MTSPKPGAHTSATLQIWSCLRDLRNLKQSIVLDGNSLDIASIVAVARYGVKPTISTDEQLAKQLDLCADSLADYLAQNWVVYGVNTGFGGSADTRTNELIDLQTHLLQHTQSAIITAADKDSGSNWEREPCRVMPPAWVRAAIVTRANQNLRGHSAIRKTIIESQIDLLDHDITPLVPLRGTISASGDLMPMSYIAGAITGNPDIFVQVGKGENAKVMPSSEALQMSGLSPSGLGPKEALGLINGTAPSVAVASLVLYDTQQLALLSQILTAFAAGCVGGNVEWAHPFIHAARPHTGQIEVASNIRSFLKGSKFVVGLDSRKKTGEGLWQDRYSTRTAPQWIGPYLEDLLLAQQQLEVELNSTSDNPLVDTGNGVSGGGGYSGGNFQAAVVTSAMDKARLAIQMIGRMLWSQVTEIINPWTNNGLEANLNASARENYTMKGIDVNMSAYMSELAALAHPVSAHVMSAEMHNQDINSLAFISARRTMEAVDLLAHMSACHIYVSCQAVDIPANHVRFLSKLRDIVTDATPNGALHGLGLTSSQIETLATSLIAVIESSWYQGNTNSWVERISSVVKAITSPVAEFLATNEQECAVSVSAMNGFRKNFEDAVSRAAEAMFYPSPTIPSAEVAAQLGEGTSQLYSWVRSKLNIPLHCGIKDDPLYNAQKGLHTEGKKSIGSWVSMVYESLLRGGMMDMVLDGLDVPQGLGTRGELRTSDGHQKRRMSRNSYLGRI